MTLFDNETDDRNFWKIIKYYVMKRKSSVKKLEHAQQIEDLLDEINKDDLY